MTEPRTRAARYALRDAIMSYLGQHIGLDVNVRDVAEATGFTEAQVRSSIYALRRDSDTLARELEVIVSGRIWRYRPQAVLQSPTPPEAQPHAQVEPVDVVSTAARPSKNSKPTIHQVVEPQTMMYVRIGELNGQVIVQDENGDCFSITPIDFRLDFSG